MGDSLFLIGLVTVITIVAIVSGFAILWLRDKLLVKKPPTQDPRTTTNKKSKSNYKTKLKRHEEVLPKSANEHVTADATGGSCQLIQAVDDYSKAANKAIGRSRMWVVIMFVIAGSVYEGGRSFLPDWMYPDYAETYIREHSPDTKAPAAQASQPQPSPVASAANSWMKKTGPLMRPGPVSPEANKRMGEIPGVNFGSNPGPFFQPAPKGPESTAAQPGKQTTYPPEFERVWEGDGESGFIKAYEDTYREETGIGFNDSQRVYVKDVLAQDVKARLYRTFIALGNSIPDEKLDAAREAAYTEMVNETGPIHQGKLMAKMDGGQVAKLNSFLSGINAASQQSYSKDRYSPAFEYFWSSGRGDEHAVAIVQQQFESMSGIKFNNLQRDYIQNSLVPDWKSLFADAFGKLDLSSGNVTGEDIMNALVECMSGPFKKHFDKLYSMMDEDQLRIIDLRRSGNKKPK